MKERIILASKSPRRKFILKLIGYKPIVRVSNCDESVVKEKDPRKLVKKLSKLKALDVAESCRNGDIVVAADTVVALDGKILGKPKDEKDAARMLRTIMGRTHEVFTGVTVLKVGVSGGIKTFVDRTSVTIDELDEEEILSYIKSGEPMDKAGAYGIQGLFAKHVSKIHGDFYTVMGLPASRVYKAIKELSEEV